MTVDRRRRHGYKRAVARDVRRGDLVYWRRRWRLVLRCGRLDDGRLTFVVAPAAPDPVELDTGAVVRIKSATARADD